jgi:hypothetical protein
MARRLASLEADSDATDRVVRWLEETHAYGDFQTYTDAMVAGGMDGLPMDRLPSEAVHAIRTRKGPPGRDVQQEIDAAVRAVVFRIHLVLRIIDTTMATLDREVLLHGYLTTLAAMSESGGEPRGLVLSIDRVRDLMMGRVGELLALQEAREIAEGRFLGGHTALFPATARAWAEQLHDSQTSAVLALRLAELDGLPDAAEEQPGLPPDGRVDQCVADLVEVARIKTLSDLNEAPAALARMQAWYRPRRETATSST